MRVLFVALATLLIVCGLVDRVAAGYGAPIQPLPIGGGGYGGGKKCNVDCF